MAKRQYGKKENKEGRVKNQGSKIRFSTIVSIVHQIANEPLKLAAFCSVLVIPSFFLPWITINGVHYTVYSGFAFGVIDKSASSGMDLRPTFFVLASALVSLILCVYALWRQKVKWINPAIRILLGIVSFIPLLTLSRETATWQGGIITANIGLWITGLAVGGLLVASASELLDILAAANRHTRKRLKSRRTT